MGSGIPWIEVCRSLEVIDRLRQVFLGQLPEMILAAQIFLISGWVDGTRRGHPGTLLRRDLNPDLLGDCARHLALQLQDVRQLALVFPRPQMRIGRRMNQLDTDPHAIARPLHRAFDHGVDIQRPCNIRERSCVLL